MRARIRRLLAVAALFVSGALSVPGNAEASAAFTCPPTIGSYVFQYYCGEGFPDETACYWAGGSAWAMFDCTTSQQVGTCDSSTCRVTTP